MMTTTTRRLPSQTYDMKKLPRTLRKPEIPAWRSQTDSGRGRLNSEIFREALLALSQYKPHSRVSMTFCLPTERHVLPRPWRNMITPWSLRPITSP